MLYDICYIVHNRRWQRCKGHTWIHSPDGAWGVQRSRSPPSGWRRALGRAIRAGGQRCRGRDRGDRLRRRHQLFDTAPQYGQGKSESRLGRVLGTKPRDSYVLSTKIGHLFTRPADPKTFAAGLKGNGYHFQVHSDYSYDGVMRSYEASLLRLGLNHVDMLVIHDIDVFHHGSREAVDRHFVELTAGGGWKALEALKAAGEIRAIGCGVNQLEPSPRSSRRAKSTSSWWPCPTRCWIRVLWTTEIPLCAARGISVVIGAVFASGILATGGVERPATVTHRHRKPFERRSSRSRRSAKRRGADPGRGAPVPDPSSARRRDHPGCLSGHERSRQSGELPARHPAGFWSDLKAEGLLRPDAPTGPG